MERFLIVILVFGFASAIPLPQQTDLTHPIEEVVVSPPEVVEDIVAVVDDSVIPPAPETELTPPIKEAVDFLSPVVVKEAVVVVDPLMDDDPVVVSDIVMVVDDSVVPSPPETELTPPIKEAVDFLSPVVVKEVVRVEDALVVVDDVVDIDLLMDDDAVVVSDIVMVVDDSVVPPPPETELTPPIKEAVDFLSPIVVKEVVRVEDAVVVVDPLMDDDAVVVSDIVMVVDDSMVPPAPETELTPPIKEAVDFLSPVVVKDDVVVVADGDCEDLTSEIGEPEDDIDREFDRIEMELFCSSKPDAPECRDFVQLEQPTANLPLAVVPDVSPIVAAKEVAREKRQIDMASQPSSGKEDPFKNLTHYRIVRYCIVFRLKCEDLLGLPEVPRADGYSVWLTKEDALPSEWTEDWVQAVGKDRFTFPAGARMQS